jgi:hypothetical protein
MVTIQSILNMSELISLVMKQLNYVDRTMFRSASKEIIEKFEHYQGKRLCMY